MSTLVSEETNGLIKELIKLLTGFDESSNKFKRTFKHFTTTLKKSHPVFASQQDIDKTIHGMCDKFCFHGLFKQSDCLRNAYKNYIPDNLPHSENVERLNVVKFLLSLSNAPTKYFLEHPDACDGNQENDISNDEINWYEYLTEGIEKWNPHLDQSSDEECGNDTDDIDNSHVTNLVTHSVVPKEIYSNDKLFTINFQASRDELLATIQHSWYNEDSFCITPESQWKEANIGILWEKHLSDQIQGLILLKKPSFISEYKVIREILYEMWSLHSGCTFKLSENNINPNPAITLASVRSYSFYEFMGELVPYMELLDFFREFNSSIQSDFIEFNDKRCCTYQSYSNSIQSIVNPIYEKLCEIEEQVKRQEKTYTLLDLSNELNTIFEPLHLLKEIHNQIILNRNNFTPLQCATTLITQLHESLSFTRSKLEQNMKIVLFLDSIYHYLQLLDSWLMKDDLRDYCDEFIIEKKTTTHSLYYNFSLRENINDDCKKNAFLRIFTEKALELGKNINFLLQLGKYDVIGDYRDTIYEEYIETILIKLNKMNCNHNETENDMVAQMPPEINQSFICPVISDKISNLNPEFDKLENLVDTTDGFLMTAFSNFFVQENSKKKMDKLTLLDRISKISTKLIPVSSIFEDCLINILEKRFTISGPMVKSILIEEHMLDKQFEFLKKLYLFFEDFIFPFYRRLFDKTSSCKTNWSIWLTSHLHDILMDLYPEFSKKCVVQINSNSPLCTNSLTVCNLIDICYDVPWPLNIVINPKQLEMYNDIFQFLLKLKWALHTVNNLVFSNLESKKRITRSIRQSFHKKALMGKLMRLKFSIINILNSLQHFVFGSVFCKNFFTFDLNFEKAHDLNSIIDTHAEFIQSIYATIRNLHEIIIEKKRDKNIFTCIELLKFMWTNFSCITYEGVADCEKMYQDFYSDISPVIFRIYVYDY